MSEGGWRWYNEGGSCWHVPVRYEPVLVNLLCPFVYYGAAETTVHQWAEKSGLIGKSSTDGVATGLWVNRQSVTRTLHIVDYDRTYLAKENWKLVSVTFFEHFVVSR